MIFTKIRLASLFLWSDGGEWFFQYLIAIIGHEAHLVKVHLNTNPNTIYHQTDNEEISKVVDSTTSRNTLAKEYTKQSMVVAKKTCKCWNFILWNENPESKKNNLLLTDLVLKRTIRAPFLKKLTDHKTNHLPSESFLLVNGLSTRGSGSIRGLI